MTKKTKFKEYYDTLLPALIGIIGVVLGSVVSGYYMVESKNIDLELSKAQLQSSASINEINNKYKIIDEYLESVLDFINRANLPKSGEKEYFDKIFNLSTRLIIYADDELLKATVDLNNAIKITLKERHSDNPQPSMENLSVVFMEWLFSARDEIMLYRNKSMSETSSKELFKSLFENF